MSRGATLPFPAANCLRKLVSERDSYGVWQETVKFAIVSLDAIRSTVMHYMINS